MRIDLTKDEIIDFAGRYSFDQDEQLSKRLLIAVNRGFMTREDLVEVAKWKWRGGRTRQLVAENTKSEVEEISFNSFKAKTERFRVGALLSLRGVQWPMASVILHFSFPDKYPILDVRAMNSVNSSATYTFEKWREYFILCRETAEKHHVSLRTLDKALWAFDKDKDQ